MSRKFKAFLLGFGVAAALAASPALAGDEAMATAASHDRVAAASEGLMPAETEHESGQSPVQEDYVTDPPLQMTPDKSQVVKLGEDAASIIVGSPYNITVVMETPRSLVVVPEAPGATNFAALAEDGHIIMQRHVIVSAPVGQYVRVRRACAPNAQNCVSTDMYWCPDACHALTFKTVAEKKAEKQKAYDSKLKTNEYVAREKVWAAQDQNYTGSTGEQSPPEE